MYFVGGSSQPTYNPAPWEALHAESAHPKAAQTFLPINQKFETEASNSSSGAFGSNSRSSSGSHSTNRSPPLGMAAAKVDQHFNKRIARDPEVMLGIFR
ncbi:hypothetical protein MMC22_008442 [Lobaria immixta]|nr:hypothetical protein [Lobaria immixta]